MNILQLNNISQYYKGKTEPAIDDLSLNIPQGAFFGLVGPNGSGKTTLTSIIAGLIKPSKGQVLFHMQHPKKTIGLIPQQIALYPNLTIAENIAYFAQLYGLSGTTLQQQIDKALSMTALQQHQNVLLSKCSGGMQRRANIAAGIVHLPKLILLDEPTAHVDPDSRNIIFNALEQLHQSGTSFIYTSHYLEEVARLCDHIAILDRGRVVGQGTIANLLTQHSDCSNLGELFLKVTGSHSPCN